MPSTRVTILVALSLLTVLTIPGGAVGQEPEAAPPDTLPIVLPDDHPDRPRAPSQPPVSVGRRITGSIIRGLTFPFRIIGPAAEGALVPLEEEGGGFATILSPDDVRPKGPKYLSILFGNVGTRSGFINGGVHVHTNSRVPSGFKLGTTASFSNHAYQEYTAYVGWNDPRKLPYARVTGFYDIDTMDEFWGLGDEAHEDDRSNFSWERWGAYASAGLPEGRGLSGEVRVGYEKSFVFEGDEPNRPDAIDLFPEIRLPQQEYWIPSATVTLDLRDAPGYPTRGVLVRADGALYRSIDELDFDWTRYGGQVQVHLPLGSVWHILSLRGDLDVVDPEGDDDIPFQYLPSLASSKTLRGYRSWRWRDRAVAYGSAEYRYRLWQEHTQNPDRTALIEASVFLDAGTVAPEIGELDSGDIKTSYGVTLRMYVNRKSYGGLTLGFSEEAVRFRFTMGDPW